LAFVGCAGQATDPEAEAAAVAAAEGWLGMIDSGQYGESWDAAAEMFRKAVPRDQWVRQLGALRQPMGARESRAVASKAYRTALPGAPDGKYVVIQFRSSFEKKKAAVETVTPMLDADGQWRVSGYFIK
jgi:hypothetical protein